MLFQAEVIKIFFRKKKYNVIKSCLQYNISTNISLGKEKRSTNICRERC